MTDDEFLAKLAQPWVPDEDQVPLARLEGAVPLRCVAFSLGFILRSRGPGVPAFATHLWVGAPGMGQLVTITVGLS